MAHRQIEGAVEVISTPLPALFTCQKGLNEPRYPSLAGIMSAKQKPLEVWNPEKLGLPSSSVGKSGAKLTTLRLEALPPRPSGRILSGDAATTVRELVRLLQEEAKVI